VIDNDERAVVEGIAAMRSVLDVLEGLWNDQGCSDCDDKRCRHRQAKIIFHIGVATDMILEGTIKSGPQEILSKRCEGYNPKNN